MAQNNNKDAGQLVSLPALLKEYRKHWWWFLTGVVVLCGLTFAYIKLTFETFGVSSTVLISDDQPSMPSAASLIAKTGLDIGNMFGGTASIYNEMALMNSYSVCLKTVKELSLNTMYIEHRGLFKKMPLAATRTPVRVSCDPSIPDTLMTGIVFKVRVAKDGDITVKTIIGKRSAVKQTAKSFPMDIVTDYGTYTLDTTSFFRPGRKLSENIVYLGYSAAAELLAEDVKVKQINKKADIIQVDMASVNPTFSRDIVSTLIRYYNATGMDQQYNRSSATYRFLCERIDSVTAGLARIEEQLSVYKTKHMTPELKVTAELDLKRYEKMSMELRRAEVDFDVMKMVKSFISDPANNLSLIPQVGDSIGSVQAVINSYNKQLLERMTIANNARPNNVSIKLIDEQLAMLRKNIDTSLDRAIDTYGFRLEKLRRLTAQAENKVSELPTTELEYGNLMRRQAIEEQIYLYLLQQREQTSMKMSNIMPRGVVLDQPHILNKPLGLSKAKKMIVAFLMGLIIPATVLFMRVRSRQTTAAV